MNEYLKKYIELKKRFSAADGGPDSVRALYGFKKELEQSGDRQAKEVLVDVYDLLDFKKDAYDLLSRIGNRSDRKRPQTSGHTEGICGKLGKPLRCSHAKNAKGKAAGEGAMGPDGTARLPLSPGSFGYRGL